jgi:ABC-type multidrug transport system permease subunit
MRRPPIPEMMRRGERAWWERPLPQLVLVRFREFVREPEALFWTFIFPVIMAAGLGVAFRSRPADVARVAVLAGSPRTSDVAAGLAAEPALEVRVLEDSAAARELRTGKVAVVVVPSAEGTELRFDDTRADALAARRLVDDALQRAAGRTDPVAVREHHVREPGSRYIDFLLPGLLGMNLLGSGVWGIGFAIVDARRKRLLKRLVATPMPRPAYLASFAISRLSMLVLEVVILLGFGALVFGVPVRGSLAALAVIAVLGALVFGGLGLLIAARPRTIEGASGLMNLAMLPMWVFSGVFFSASRFPDAMQPFIQALPLTAVNDALRANLLEGAGLAQVAPELGLIAVWLVGTFLIALRIFRWQ